MYSPRLDEFQKLAAHGNLIPVTRRLLADIETPLSAYRKIRGAGESFLFESVEGGEHIGRYSFVGCNPRALIRQTGNRIEVVENGKVIESFGVRSADIPVRSNLKHRGDWEFFRDPKPPLRIGVHPRPSAVFHFRLSHVPQKRLKNETT
jgi:anthranilate/para-aminobenzoate synthase component I